MIVAHVCQTPVAGAAWAWAEAFKEAGYDSFSVAARHYKDGRRYPSDENWPPGKEAIERIRSADVIFCHQGDPYKYPWYPKSKPTVLIYHGRPSDVCRVGQHDGRPWAVVGQYQTRLFPGCPPVPNLIPLKSPLYQPGGKPTDCVQIAYSPSNTHKTGWDDKGYAATVRALLQVAAASGRGTMPAVQADIITGVGLIECLRRKAVAHIVIDECVTGSYHRSSMEALAQGAVVINNADAFCCMNVRRMTGNCNPPFVATDLAGLPETLRLLVGKGPIELGRLGMDSRRWMEVRGIRPN